MRRGEERRGEEMKGEDRKGKERRGEKRRREERRGQERRGEERKGEERGEEILPGFRRSSFQFESLQISVERLTYLLNHRIDYQYSSRTPLGFCSLLSVFCCCTFVYSRLRTSTGPKILFELRNVRIKGSSYKNALKDNEESISGVKKQSISIKTALQQITLYN